jgi:hypothetical protein
MAQASAAGNQNLTMCRDANETKDADPWQANRPTAIERVLPPATRAQWTGDSRSYACTSRLMSGTITARAGRRVPRLQFIHELIEPIEIDAGFESERVGPHLEMQYAARLASEPQPDPEGAIDDGFHCLAAAAHLAAKTLGDVAIQRQRRPHVIVLMSSSRDVKMIRPRQAGARPPSIHSSARRDRRR